MKTTLFIVLFLELAVISSSWAESCSWESGGYCVDTLTKETLRVIRERNDPKTAAIETNLANKMAFSMPQPATDPLAGGTTYYNLYESLWREFVQSGLMEEKERNTAYEEAAATGGTKIGGVNLVVLGARTLQKLVDLKLLTLEQAQGILDQSRRSQ